MIVNLNEIVDGEVRTESPLSASCKLCRTILYDDEYFTDLTVENIHTAYFYCEECSDDRDQEISFEKKYKVKAISVEFEEIN